MGASAPARRCTGSSDTDPGLCSWGLYSLVVEGAKIESIINVANIYRAFTICQVLPQAVFIGLDSQLLQRPQS